MRRSVTVLALLAVCAIFVAPASAQTTIPGWFVNGHVGPAFGTLGDTAAFAVSGGYRTYDWMSFGVEFGMLPRAEFEKASPVIPGVSIPVADPSDVYVNKLHFNGNMFVHPFSWERFAPYTTVGIGAASGLIRAKSDANVALPREARNVSNPAVNLGGGGTVRLTNWLGLTADYRHFIVLGPTVRHVNRVLTGVSLFSN